MIFKSFILLIALSYVHSSPVDPADKALFDKFKVSSDKISPVALSSKDAIQSEPLVEAVPTSEEKKLSRVVRNNKVEYVYLNSDGEVIPRPGLLTKSKFVFYIEKIKKSVCSFYRVY